jgi:DNA-binding transcriptional regulator YdaS (Cro superfamily)
VTSREEGGDTLAAAIIALRKRVGSQAKLAKLLSTTDRTVKRWERGAVPNGRFRQALIAEGIPAELFEQATRRELLEAGVRQVQDLADQVEQLRRLVDELIARGAK